MKKTLSYAFALVAAYALVAPAAYATGTISPDSYPLPTSLITHGLPGGSDYLYVYWSADQSAPVNVVGDGIDTAHDLGMPTEATENQYFDFLANGEGMDASSCNELAYYDCVGLGAFNTGESLYSPEAPTTTPTTTPMTDALGLEAILMNVMLFIAIFASVIWVFKAFAI